MSIEETIKVFKDQGVQDFDTCYAYVVFPKISAGGIGIGGKGGTGEAFLVAGEDSKKVGDVQYGAASMGGIGFETYQQVVFIQDMDAFEKFSSGKFELKYDYKLTAGTASAGGEVGTSANVEGSVGDKGAGASAYIGGVKVVVASSKGLYFCGNLAGNIGFGELGAGKYSYTPVE